MGGWSERVMGQKGFFDVERRLDAISALGDPLETIKKIVPWEDFRTDIEAVTEMKPEERKSNAGRKPYDTILKFKIMVLQSLHNLSDDRTEYLIRDRISFMRCLELELARRGRAASPARRRSGGLARSRRNGRRLGRFA